VLQKPLLVLLLPQSDKEIVPYLLLVLQVFEMLLLL
jgi:hypothetical protein